MDPKEKAELFMMDPCPVIFAQNEHGMVKELLHGISCFSALDIVAAPCLAGNITGFASGQGMGQMTEKRTCHLNDVQTFILAFRTLYNLNPIHHFSLLFHCNSNTLVGWILLSRAEFLLGLQVSDWASFPPLTSLSVFG